MIPEPRHVAEVRSCWHDAADVEHAVFLFARVSRCLRAMAEATPNDARALERKADAIAHEGRELLEIAVDWQRRISGADLSQTVATWIAAPETNDLADVLSIPVEVLHVAADFSSDVARAWLFDRDLFSNTDDLRTNVFALSEGEQGRP